MDHWEAAVRRIAELAEKNQNDEGFRRQVRQICKIAAEASPRVAKVESPPEQEKKPVVQDKPLAPGTCRRVSIKDAMAARYRLIKEAQEKAVAKVIRE